MLNRHFSIYLIAYILPAAVGFFAVTAYTRLLTPSEYGVYVVGISLAGILGAIFFAWIKLSVSRNREYLADAQGAMLTRYPPGLIAALEKIAATPTAMHSANNATAHLWLNQPSRIEGDQMGPLEKLFATHPPIQDRIARLKEM